MMGKARYQSFREIVMQCKRLPLPIVVVTALKLLRSPDGDLDTLCRVLADDAALVARFFRLAQSAIYGRVVRSETLREALVVLGMRTVRRVLMTASAHALCGGRGPAAETFWDHSLATVLTTQILAQRVGFPDCEQAFLAGLFHAVGQMFFLQRDPKAFDEISQQIRDSTSQ